MPVEDFDDKYLNPSNANNDINDRINTASEIKPSMSGPEFGVGPVPNNNQGGEMSMTHANTNASIPEKSKVQIKPYKFTFD